jgi:hypothetical protein
VAIVAKERLIFIREHANNAYGTMAYSLAQFLVHLPFLAVLAILFSAYEPTDLNALVRALCLPLTHSLTDCRVIGRSSRGSSCGYWLVGLYAGGEEYIYFNLTMWVCMATGQALVVMVSTAVEDMQIANAIVTAWFALMLFFGGFFITLNDVCRTRCTCLPERSSWTHPISCSVFGVAEYRFQTIGFGSTTCRSSSIRSRA